MIVRTKVPLICFAIVEWHPTDKIMRQFRLQQIISDDPPNLDQPHDIDMRERINIFLPHHHHDRVAKWNHWNDYIVHGELDQGLLHENSEYMQWYIRQTRWYILHEGTLSIEIVSSIYNFKKLLILLFIIISNFVNLESQYYPGHHQHQSYVEPNVPPVHVSEYMPNIIHHKHNINQQPSLDTCLKDVNKVFNQ